MLHDIHPLRSPEETRVRILAATRRLMGKKGRRGTTTREIAELAGVNEATLFRHFGNKDAIIEACVDFYCPAGAIQEAVAMLGADLDVDLKRIALFLVERMEENRDLILMSLNEEESESSVGTAPWRAPTAIKQIVADYMTKRVESGELQGDPLLLARVFMGMIFSHVIGRKKFSELNYSTEEIMDFQINVFLNGVRKKN